MIRKYFFPDIDRDVQHLVDVHSTKNIRSISLTVAIFELISLVLFVLSRKGFGRQEWISMGSVTFCAVACLCGYIYARHVLKKPEPGHLSLTVFNAVYFTLMSLWSVWTSYRQYGRGEQLLTFYAVQIMLVCFIALKPWLSTLLTAAVYLLLYWTVHSVDGAAGINLLNYVVLALVSIIGVTVRYHSLVSLSEATVRLQASKDSEIRDKMDILQAMSDIYDNVNLIDFTDNTEMSVRDKTHTKHSIEMGPHAHTLMSRGIRERVMPDQLESFIAFTDIATVRQRLVGKKLISRDFIDVVDGWIRAQYIPVDVDADGTPIRIIFTTRNVDEEKKREEHLTRIAMTDELTRLYNRRSYDEDLAECREKGFDAGFALLCADVNGLKRVNDTLGHAAGDELIRGAADCLLLAVGSQGKVYRTGGDEFVAILRTGDTEAVCRDIQQRTYAWRGKHAQRLSVSIGCATHAANPDLDIHGLEKKADAEMYQSKAQYYKANGLDRRRR